MKIITIYIIYLVSYNLYYIETYLFIYSYKYISKQITNPVYLT